MFVGRVEGCHSANFTLGKLPYTPTMLETTRYRQVLRYGQTLGDCLKLIFFSSVFSLFFCNFSSFRFTPLVRSLLFTWNWISFERMWSYKRIFSKRCDNFTTCFFYNRIFFLPCFFFLFFEDVKRVKIFDMSPFTQQTQKGDERKNLISFIERLIKITAL